MVDRNAASIADQLLTLPSPDRARLAELLLASLEERDTDAEALWDSEIDRRSTELATGRVVGIAATDVFAEVERRLRALAATLAVAIVCALVAPAAAAQALGASCFRFDKPYFTAVTRTPAHEVVTRRTATLQLLPDSAPRFYSAGRFQLLAVLPVPFEVDSFTFRRWTGMSGWRPLPADSVQIEWRNGLYGPVFRLHVEGDSLVGTVVQTTDAFGDGKPRDGGPYPARAYRVTCNAP